MGLSLTASQIELRPMVTRVINISTYGIVYSVFLEIWRYVAKGC